MTPFPTITVNKVIRTAKDVKASAKDMFSFADWLFAHGFSTQDTHDSLAKICGSVGKMPKKKASENLLNTNSSQPSPMTVMPNGLVRPPSNPQMRAERAGKTLSRLMNHLIFRVSIFTDAHHLQSNTASSLEVSTMVWDRSKA